jgi:dolichyl-phosphate beta-glucosyltransferase
MQPLVQRSLSVVIPSYNEEARLPRTLREVGDFLASRGCDAEILVVDDGSRDRTREAATAAGASCPLVKVLGYLDNRGKGFAVRTGFLAATREAVLVSDADLSTPIGELDRMWPFYDQGYDVVIGSRRLSGARLEIPQPLYRRGMGRAFNLIVSTLAVRGFQDTQCGFKLFRRAASQEMFRGLRTRGFAFDVELLLRARRLGLRVREVPVRWINSPDSRVRVLRDSARMLREIFRMRGLL